MSSEQLFDPKQTNLPYTVCIIKPDTTLKQKIVQQVIDKIESERFIIKNFIQRELFKEEIINIFYQHQKKPFMDDIVDYMLSGECIVLLLCHETENPIEKWKKIIGPMDPLEAKKSDPTSLRAQFGFTLIKNEFHGSDNPYTANKERDVFKFPIPQKIPDFQFDRMLISLENLFKFLYPPNLEHFNANERMDLFAIYGPCVNYHSVDQCLCSKCSRIGKMMLEEVKQRKINREREILGLQTKALPSKFTTKTNFSSSTIQVEDKVKVPPMRLIMEQDLQSIWNQMCEKCQKHCESFTHLCGGRDMQHILSDQEINNIAKEINKVDLLDLLIAEKGKAAKIMIETIEITEPNDLHYTREMIELLLKDLQTDYYNRYQFYDLQQVILEDRRIRLNAWVAQLINKPINRFKNPKLIDPTISQDQRHDTKNIHFTLQRQLPLSMTYKKKDITITQIEFPSNLADKKSLEPHEEKLANIQKLHRDTHKMVSIEDLKKGDGYKVGVQLLRNYNEGRHGEWNNYCTLKGKDKGTYVNYSKQ